MAPITIGCPDGDINADPDSLQEIAENLGSYKFH
jgi:hypothetical protein